MGRHDQMNAGRFVALLYHDVHPGGGFDYRPMGQSAKMYHVAEGRSPRRCG
jgi:hypothetical protein